MDNNCISVSALNGYIKTVMDRDDFLSSVAVRGEISNFKRNISGHLYFSLKDDNSSISAVMFRTAASRLTFVPSDGMKVTLYGRVSVYEKSGQYQIYAETLMPDGAGELALAYERLKRRLEEEGLFSADKKKKLPKLPRRVGIVTSPTGAAIRDMLNVSERRYPLADIVIFPAAVQGAEAPSQLTTGIGYFNAMRNVDVIIIGRGGGSIEDLWAFNDEALVRAVAASDIPVISAVGHEIDYTLCDFAADCRAPTPSAAAELAFPDSNAISAYLAGKESSFAHTLASRISRARNELSQIEKILSLNSPTAKLDSSKMAVLNLATRLENAMDIRLRDGKSRLSELSAKLSGMNPLSVLSRGYGMISSEDGRVIGSASALSCGDRIGIKMADGDILAEVVDISVGKDIRNEN